MSSRPPNAHLAASPPAARRLAPLRFAVRLLAGLLGAACLALFVGWLSLHWLILPHIEEWRVPIEARASLLLGAPVKIGAIEVRSSGWVPALELRDVRVLDAEQRVALSLPRVAAALSPRSVLALEPRFAQLLIDAPSLDIRRDASGHIRVAGLDFGGNVSGTEADSDVAHWFFKQEEFVIRGGTVRWIDEQRQAPPLVLAGVDLVVRNGLREHALRIDATPPAGWGDRFTLRGRFSQPIFARAGDWRRWSGSVYADLPRADVRELRQYVQLPFELSEGDGALRGWFDVHEGQPAGATVDLALRAVALRLDKSVEPLEFEQVEGRFSAQKKDDRIAIDVRGFGFVTGDGIRWPKGNLSVAWRQPEGQDVTSGEFAAERLDVGVMAGIAGRVPLGAALRELLADVHPQGVITQLSTRWDGPLDAPAHYRVKGLLSGLSLTARAAARADAVGRPGLRNATVQLDANEGGGEARIGVQQGVLDLPGVFAEPELAFDRLDAKLGWKIEARSGDAPKITVRVRDARFANPDAEGELSAIWRTGSGSGTARGGRYPGELELDGKIANGHAARTGRYLPLGLPDSVRSYVGRAVLGGTIASASFRVRGDLWDFPFHGGKAGRDGEFRIAAKVDDLSFAYVPGPGPATAEGAAPLWPPFTAASGELIVDRTVLEIRDARAQLSGVEWTHIHGSIPQLGDHARLDIEGNARGPLTDMLRYVNATPIGRWIGRALATTTASGAADLKLGLAIPLDDPGKTRVKGSLALAGNDVRMTPDTPLLAGAKGRVDFTQSGFTVAAASARVLGGDLAFDGGTQGEVQRFSGQGTATAEGLRNAPELGTVSRLAASLSGQASYRATLAFSGGQPQIGVTSNLVGFAIDLPAPIGKAAATPVALRVQTALDATAPAGALPRETLQVELGSVLQARFVRDGTGETSRVARGAIRVLDPLAASAGEAAEPLVLPASGVAATVTMKRLEVDRWEAAANRLFAEPGRGAAAPLVFDASGGSGYVPDHIALRVAELAAGTRRLTNLTAGLSQENGLWRANVDSNELDGYVEYRPARRGAAAASGAGRVYARLSRLRLPKGEAERVESLLEEQPASVPALDIVVEDFELRGKRLGRLEIEAANRATGTRDGGREWQLSKFNLLTPEAQLTATGTWGAGAAPGAPRRAAMDFTLALADSGALLERLGMGKVVRGGKGSLAGSVSWPGSPLSPDTATMSGQFKVAIDSGQFLKAGPGAARLLSVLSLQSLPRRLSLDFRDLFEEGFAFDNVTGDVKIGLGVATTNNLRMRGSAAAVLMEGNADLERETQDLRVVVVPEINAGTASLAYAIINPAVGLGTFLAQYFLRKPLTAAGTREFRVTGPWDDPKVDRVERSAATGAPPVDSPAASSEPAPTTTR
ncbi:MAG: YhdP family protein [Caldimonas sp.]